MEHKPVQDLQDVVIRFSGDSGDGMQLTGTLFSDTAALMGNSISTFPDYPAEIRAPQGTVAGVSGFQSATQIHMAIYRRKGDSFIAVDQHFFRHGYTSLYYF